MSYSLPIGLPTLQVWMLVQRKWMYLESIFIGGDIRSQLPEEAKKFDNIDKIFKKVNVWLLASADTLVRCVTHSTATVG